MNTIPMKLQLMMALMIMSYKEQAMRWYLYTLQECEKEKSF